MVSFALLEQVLGPEALRLSGLTSSKKYETTADALEAARHLAASYDCVVVTQTFVDVRSGQTIGKDLVLAQYGDMPVSDT